MADTPDILAPGAPSAPSASSGQPAPGAPSAPSASSGQPAPGAPSAPSGSSGQPAPGAPSAPPCPGARVPLAHTRPPKPPKTPEDLAAIAFLDSLRTGNGETPPEGLPLACIVRIEERVDVPKAHEAYALVRVAGPAGRTWRLCVFRSAARVGERALFIHSDAALPVEDRYRNSDVCTVKEKVYKFGADGNERRLLPHVKRHIYGANSGVLYPLALFPELAYRGVGEDVTATLCIESADRLKKLQTVPRRERDVTFGAPRRGERPARGLLGKLRRLGGW